MKIAPLLLLVWLLAASAPPPAPVEGTYVLNEMEMGSAIRLTGDHRFQWFFSTGALDLTGEGRWEQAADGVVILTSDPPVAPPRFELAATKRDRRRGVLVQVSDPAGHTPEYLEAAAEYDDGSVEPAHLDSAGHRFRPARGRRIVAVRLGSTPFDLASDRYPVTADRNHLAFRFLPNDLGKESFQASRVAVEPDALTLTLRGQPLRYEREVEPPEAPIDEDLVETEPSTP
jgi:hypothetical protein